MTERTVAKASRGAQPPVRYDSGDDNISVTSTAVSDTDPDAEYPVKSVLFEAVMDNERYLCIEWDGYPRERGTYERVDDLDAEVINMWNDTKMRRDRGLEETVTQEEFEALKHKVKQERKQRRRLRRKKRIRLGLPPGPEISSDEEDHILSSEESGHSSDSSIEASEIPDTIEDAPGMGQSHGPKRVSGIFGKSPMKTSVKQQNQKNRQNSDSDEDDSASSEDLIVAEPNKRRRRSSRTEQESHSRLQSRLKRKRPSSLSESDDDDDLPLRKKGTNKTPATATGYQGTARPASSSNNNPTQREISGPRERGVAARGTARGGPSSLQMGSRNVFQSLKPAKKKSKLPESELSKDKKTVQYAKNMSDLRRIELHARALADRAPDPSVLGGLFNPTTGSGYGPKKSASVPTPASDTTSKSKPRARFVDDGELATVLDDAPMIFEEPQDMEEEPQTITPSNKQSAQTSEQSTSKTTNSEKEPLDKNTAVPQRSAPKKTVSFQDYTTKLKATQFGDDTMVKEVKFGTAAKPITVAFEGINPSSSEAWVKDFHASKEVVFDHMCFAKAFLQQFWEKFCTQIIHHGALMADSKTTSTLESLQVFLSQKLAGLAYHYSDFVVLAYPMGCKEWQWENIYGTSIQSKSTPTRYVVFRMSSDLASFLRLPYKSTSASASSAATINFKEHRKALASSMHSLDFVNLIPAKTEPQRKFFIFFPPNSLPSPEFITAWLKAFDPEREVVDCISSTMAWAKYTMEARPSPIVVMIHHSLVPIIPWLSGLRKLIINGSTFWSIGCEPSILGIENVVAPYTATRIFPHGAAILLTPSFIVAEPRQLRDFLENFFRKYRDATPGTYKLVGCYKLQEYLLDIALEKAAERKELLADHRHIEGDVESIATQKGLSFVECEARLECYILVKRMMEQENMLGYYYPWDMARPQEHMSPIVYAGDGIGQDSEEALIKWFAGWAMCNIDQHRKFIVLGSGKSASTVIRYKDIIVEETKTISGSGTPDVEKKSSTRSTSKAVDSTRNSAEKESASPLSFGIPSKATLSSSKARFKNTFTTVMPKEEASTETIDTGNSRPESDTPRQTLDSATASSLKAIPQLDGGGSPLNSPPHSSSSMDPSTQLHHETAAASAASHAEPKIQVHTQTENSPRTGDAPASSNPTPTSLTSAPATNGHKADEPLQHHKNGRTQSPDELIVKSSDIVPDSHQPDNTNIVAPEQASASSVADNDDLSPRTRALSPETLVLRHKLEHFMVHTGTDDDMVAMQYLADADADVPNAIKLFDDDVRRRTASQTPAQTGSPRSDSTRPRARGPYPLQSVESADDAVAAIVQTDGNAEAPSSAGIVGREGPRAVPGSVRENGMPREDVSIRPGFGPEEDVDRHKVRNRRAVSRESTTAASVASSMEKMKTVKKEVIKYTSTLDWYTARIKAGRKWEHLDVLSWEDAMELVKVRSK